MVLQKALKPPISGYLPVLVEIALGGLFNENWLFLYRHLFLSLSCIALYYI
jgi:hypothetical protein